MKGCRIALILMLLIAIGVTVNAVYVVHVSRSLTICLDTLPDLPDPEETPEAVGGIKREFEQDIFILGITIPYATLDRIRESLLRLEIYAAAGDQLRYAETLAVLRELAEEIARAEVLSVRVIL